MPDHGAESSPRPRIDRPERFDAYVLAAGRGSRMGGPKALLKLEGEYLFTAIARRYRELGARTVWGIVAEEQAAALRGIPAGRDPKEDPRERPDEDALAFLTMVHPDRPMMDSVRIAFARARERAVDHFFLQPVDAGVPAQEVITALLHGIGDALVAKPCHRGSGGHPLLLHRTVLGEMDWREARSLRTALRSLPEAALRRIECDDPSVLRNWNRPEDLNERSR